MTFIEHLLWARYFESCYGLNMKYSPPKAHVFEHLVQAKNAVCEGCRTFRRWRKKLVGAWGGP